MKARTVKLWLCFSVLIVAMVLPGCFSIPFLGGPGIDRSKVEPQQRQFARNSVFVGYDDDGNPIVEMRLISQEVTPEKGLIVNTRLFPTENFRVRNIFRGLRSINYYPIERRFHRLELDYMAGQRKRDVKMKVVENIEVHDDGRPVDASFEHTDVFRLLPDTILAAELKFQDVDKWDRMPEDTLDTWYAAKQEFLDQVEAEERRENLVNAYRRRQQRTSRQETFNQYDSVYVTTNNAYVYLEKDVGSEILFTANAGDEFDYGVSDGIWVEVPLPDSLRESVSEFLDLRRDRALQKWETQRRLMRTRRQTAPQDEAEIDTTWRSTGYILDVMVHKNYEQAIEWEKDNLTPPVDVPLFAQVLRDREAARLARIDSARQAREDSIARANAPPPDSTAAGDSTAVPADSTAGPGAPAAPAAQPDTTASVSAQAATAPDGNQQAAAAPAVPADTSGQGVQQAEPAVPDTSGAAEADARPGQPKQEDATAGGPTPGGGSGSQDP